MNGSEGTLSTLYFRNRYLLVLTMVMLLLGGLVAIHHLPRLEDPRITTRNGSVLTFLPGASAAQVEALINEHIERILEEIDEIKKIESTARAGVSSIQIELQDDITVRNNEIVFAKIRSRLQQVRTQLPPDSTIPVLDNQRGATAYTLIVALSWPGELEPSLNSLNRIALDLKDRMLNVANTELVRMFGGIEEEISVVPDKGELAALNMSVAQLADLIKRADGKIAAGQLHTSEHDLLIEIHGDLDRVQQIATIPLSSGRTTLTVGDIAQIKRSYKQPVAQLGLKDGQRVIYVAVRADKNIRVDRWTAQALQAYAHFCADYDGQIGSEIIFEQNKYTKARLADLTMNLILGVLIVIALVLLTMGWKSALVVGSVLPLAIAGSVFAFNFFNQSIHQMSIFGLIIAIGLLIDSAIVMTDEVRKSICEQGMPRLQAIQQSVHHLFVPLFASTFTTILGFMPLFLLPGNAGDFISPIAISVILALMFSFFLAVTVVPALAAYAISEVSGPSTWWQSGLPAPRVFADFKQFTVRAMTQPKRYLLLVMMPCWFGFLLLTTMKVEFFPAADRDMFELHLHLPNSSTMAQTEQQVALADAAIKRLSHVTSVHWLLGASIPSVYYNQIPMQDNNSAFAQAVIKISHNKMADALISKVQHQLNQLLPDATPIVKKFAQGPPTQAPVALRISGSDIDVLRQLGEQVRARMHQHPDVIHTLASIQGGQPKLWLTIDRAKRDPVGLNIVDVATQLQGYFAGVLGGRVLEDVQSLPVRVRLQPDQRRDTADVLSTQLIQPHGHRWFPVGAVGTLTLRPEVAAITRYNGQRANNVYAYIQPHAKPVSVSNDVLASLADLQLPAGYRIIVAGETEQQANAVTGLATFAPILLMLMVTTIILTFRSVALAVIVALVAALSTGLGLLSLNIAGYPLGFNPLIGTIGLAGVIINDTIVILAAILGNQSARLGDGRSIVEQTYGCGRHVISTTITTIGGFLPLLWFSDGTFWPPLTVVIAGGMGFGLMLAMFFTPLAYQVYANWRYRS